MLPQPLRHPWVVLRAALVQQQTRRCLGQNSLCSSVQQQWVLRWVPVAVEEELAAGVLGACVPRCQWVLVPVPVAAVVATGLTPV